MASVNPYSSPLFEPTDPIHQSRAVQCDFGPIIWRWEKLRCLYNAVLVPWVLGLAIIFHAHELSSLVFWIEVALAGGVANLCFLIGPAAEGYGAYFGGWRFATTMILFLIGTIFTVAVAGLLLGPFVH